MAQRFTRTLGILAATAAVALALTSCAGGSAGDSASGDTAGKTVKLGVVGAGEPYWATYEKAVEAAGIDLEIVDFSDYNQLNPAVSEGELDINQFQHIIFLADYNVNNDDSLVPIGATAIYPLGLYSQKYKSAEEIPDGETVIVPNDDTNQARGLLVLQSAGLIELTGGGSPFSTLADVDTKKSRVKVTAVDAAVTASSLVDAAAAVVNNDYLTDAGLTAEDAIAQDDPSDESAFPYINIFATTKERADDETLNKLVEIYQTDKDVQKGVQESSGGTAVFATNPASELQTSLADVEADLKKGK